MFGDNSGPCQRCQLAVVSFRRTSREPVQNIATHNEGPYLRSSSQGAWMEELRAHQRCAVYSFNSRHASHFEEKK
jgi:hypothetical protein